MSAAGAVGKPGIAGGVDGDVDSDVGGVDVGVAEFFVPG
jgi:hypothetical protein